MSYNNFARVSADARDMMESAQNQADIYASKINDYHSQIDSYKSRIQNEGLDNVARSVGTEMGIQMGKRVGSQVMNFARKKIAKRMGMSPQQISDAMKSRGPQSLGAKIKERMTEITKNISDRKDKAFDDAKASRLSRNAAREGRSAASSTREGRLDDLFGRGTAQSVRDTQEEAAKTGKNVAETTKEQFKERSRDLKVESDREVASLEEERAARGVGEGAETGGADALEEVARPIANAVEKAAPRPGEPGWKMPTQEEYEALVTKMRKTGSDSLNANAEAGDLSGVLESQSHSMRVVNDRYRPQGEASARAEPTAGEGASGERGMGEEASEQLARDGSQVGSSAIESRSIGLTDTELATRNSLAPARLRKGRGEAEDFSQEEWNVAKSTERNVRGARRQGASIEELDSMRPTEGTLTPLNLDAAQIGHDSAMNSIRYQEETDNMMKQPRKVPTEDGSATTGLGSDSARSIDAATKSEVDGPTRATTGGDDFNDGNAYEGAAEDWGAGFDLKASATKEAESGEGMGGGGMGGGRNPWSRQVVDEDVAGPKVNYGTLERDGGVDAGGREFAPKPEMIRAQDYERPEEDWTLGKPDAAVPYTPNRSTQVSEGIEDAIQRESNLTRGTPRTIGRGYAGVEEEGVEALDSAKQLGAGGIGEQGGNLLKDLLNPNVGALGKVSGGAAGEMEAGAENLARGTAGETLAAGEDATGIGAGLGAVTGLISSAMDVYGAVQMGVAGFDELKDSMGMRDKWNLPEFLGGEGAAAALPTKPLDMLKAHVGDMAVSMDSSLMRPAGGGSW